MQVDIQVPCVIWLTVQKLKDIQLTNMENREAANINIWEAGTSKLLY